jgi:hypothetical protein
MTRDERPFTPPDEVISYGYTDGRQPLFLPLDQLDDRIQA